MRSGSRSNCSGFLSAAFLSASVNHASSSVTTVPFLRRTCLACSACFSSLVSLDSIASSRRYSCAASFVSAVSRRDCSCSFFAWARALALSTSVAALACCSASRAARRVVAADFFSTDFFFCASSSAWICACSLATAFAWSTCAPLFALVSCRIDVRFCCASTCFWAAVLVSCVCADSAASFCCSATLRTRSWLLASVAALTDSEAWGVAYSGSAVLRRGRAARYARERERGRSRTCLRFCAARCSSSAPARLTVLGLHASSRACTGDLPGDLPGLRRSPTSTSTTRSSSSREAVRAIMSRSAEDGESCAGEERHACGNETGDVGRKRPAAQVGGCCRWAPGGAQGSAAAQQHGLSHTSGRPSTRCRDSIAAARLLTSGLPPAICVMGLRGWSAEEVRRGGPGSAEGCSAREGFAGNG